MIVAIVAGHQRAPPSRPNFVRRRLLVSPVPGGASDEEAGAIPGRHTLEAHSNIRQAIVGYVNI